MMHPLFPRFMIFLGCILTACGPLQKDPVVIPVPSPTVLSSAEAATPFKQTPSAASLLTPSPANSLTRWGKGTIRGGGFSPDGSLLGVITAEGIYRYDAQTLQLLDTVYRTSTWPAAAFSPDWTLLAAGAGASISLVRLADGMEIARLTTQQGVVARLLFSPDGRMLASLVQPPGEEVYTQLLELWDVQEGRLLGTWEAGAMPELVFSPDSQSLYAFNPFRMKEVAHWQVPSGTRLPAPVGSTPMSMVFSPDGQRIAGTYLVADGVEIRIQQVSDWKVVARLRGERQPFAGRLRFTPDGSKLVAFSEDGFVQVWEAADGTVVRSFATPLASGRSFMEITPDGKTLALPYANGLVFYHLADGQMLRRLEGHPDSPRQALFSPQGDRAAALLGSDSTENSSLVVWRVPDGTVEMILPKMGALALAWSPAGDRLALAGWDGKIYTVEAAGGRLLQTLPGHSEQVQSVAWSPDSKWLASSSMEAVRIWQAEDGALRYDLAAPGGWVTNLWFSPDGQALAGQSAEGSLWVWQLADGQPVRSFSVAAQGEPVVVRFAPDGSFFAAAFQARVWFYHLEEAQPFQSLPPQKADVTSLAISPDGSWLACGLGDATIQLWQLPERKLIQTAQMPGVATGLDFSQDGRSLLVATQAGSIQFWDIPTSP